MKQKGFTLIEVLIVLAIVGILLAVAIPQFQKYKNEHPEKYDTSDRVSPISK